MKKNSKKDIYVIFVEIYKIKDIIFKKKNTKIIYFITKNISLKNFIFDKIKNMYSIKIVNIKGEIFNFFFLFSGIMCILDDICSQVHAQNEGADEQFLAELNKHMAQNEHYQSGAQSFVIKHYAGIVCSFFFFILNCQINIRSFQARMKIFVHTYCSFATMISVVKSL